MREASWLWFGLLLFVLVARFAHGADSKLSDTLKNMTQSRNTTSGNQNGEENLLKTEIKQYLRECGANLPEDEGSGQRFSNSNRSNNNYDFKNRRYSNNYDSGNYENRRNYWNQNGNTNNGKRGGYRNDNNNDENCGDGNSGGSQNPFANYAQNGYNMMGRPNYGNNHGNTHGDYHYGNCNYESNGYSYGGGGQDGYGYNRGNSNNNNGNRGTYDLNYGNRNPGNEQGNSGNGYGSNSFMDKGQGGNWNDNGGGSYFRGKRSEGSAQVRKKINAVPGDNRKVFQY